MISQARKNSAKIQKAIGQELDFDAFLELFGRLFNLLSNFDSLVDVSESHFEVVDLLVVTAPVVVRYQQHTWRVTVVPVGSLEVFLALLEFRRLE